jgi:hypothetical protein
MLTEKKTLSLFCSSESNNFKQRMGLQAAGIPQLIHGVRLENF